MTDFFSCRRHMVDSQIRPSDVTKFPIIEAMLSIPRESFVPEDRRGVAYMSENLSLGHGRVILEPRTLAKMLDALNIQPDELVLDIGCGLGYSAAVIARLGEAVVALEEVPELAAEAEAHLAENGFDNVVLVAGTLAAGAPQHGPYDVITIEGAVASVPDAIIDQLKEGGRIGCLFSEGAVGLCRIGYKIDGKVTWRFAFNAAAPVLPGFERLPAFSL